MSLTPKQIAEWLRDVESDLSSATNDTKAAEKAYQRIIERCAVAANMIDALSEGA